MKELTIKEKAKRYDEAIERAREINNEQRAQPFNVMIRVFPELKESEDERIRKAIKLMYSFLPNNPEYIGGVPIKEIFAWLEEQGDKSVNIDIESMVSSYKQRLKSQGGIENSPLVNMCLTAFRHGVENTLEELNLKKLEKQGEQKPADKVEPKFKVGDWIANKSHDICLITEIDLENSYYICESNRFGNIDGDIDLTDKAFHLWTIEDAKDGDVLATLNHILIFEAIISKDGGVSYCHYDFGSSRPQFDFNKDDNWYFGKEAKVYPATKEQRGLLFQKMKEAGYEWDADKKELKKIEQRPVKWSKEDEAGLGDALWAIQQARAIAKDENDMGNLWYAENWLKSLKDRVQPKQEWSEDDEQYLLVCKNALRKYQVTDKWDSNIISQWLDNKLKSLRPQNTCKPSDGQIKACKEVYADILSAKGFDLGTINSELNRLEEKLKKHLED